MEKDKVAIWPDSQACQHLRRRRELLISATATVSNVIAGLYKPVGNGNLVQLISVINRKEESKNGKMEVSIGKVWVGEIYYSKKGGGWVFNF